MLSPATTPPRFPTLVLLSGLSVLTLNMFVPSLSAIAASFAVDYGVVTMAVAAYAGMSALLQLVVGPLSDRFGRRPVLLISMALFALASLGCALAPSIESFLACRMLQGAVVAGNAVSMAVVRDSAPPQKAASLIGYLAMAWAVVPMLGPVLGGTLDGLFGWRASFWTFTGLGLLAWMLAWLDLGETNRNPSRTFGQQFRAYPDLFRSRRFWGYALCMTFSTGGFYIFIGGVPLVATTLFAMSPELLGFCMGTITAGFVFGSFLSGRYATRFEMTGIILIGRLLACTGPLAGLTILAAGIVDPVTLFGACMFVGVGNGLTMPSASSGAMSVRPRLAGSAAGMAGAMVVGGGGALSALTGWLITPANAPFMLLGLMFAASGVSLLAILAVRRIDRREGPPGTPAEDDAVSSPDA